MATLRRGVVAVVLAAVFASMAPLAANATPVGPNPTAGSTTGGTVVTVPGVRFTQVSTSLTGTNQSAHVLALASTGQAYSWGFNNRGQLGNGTTTNSSLPTAVTMPSGVTFTQVAAGDYHSVALGSDGKAYAWGANAYGQLGNGTGGGGAGDLSGNSSVPVAVTMPSGITFTQILAADTHTVALGSDGKVYAWGDNTKGQLGDGTTTGRTIPTMAATPAGVTFTQVVIGVDYTGALSSTGTLYMWGANDFGELANGTSDTNPHPTPTPINALPSGAGTIVKVVSGAWQVIALDSNGKAYAWGNDLYGNVGNGTNGVNAVTNPVAVTMPQGVTFASIASGASTSLGLTSSGAAYTWGDDGYGQLGRGTQQQEEDTPAAVSMPNGVTFTSAVVGNFSVYAVGSDGNVYAWGCNDYGQLGDGTTNLQTTPYLSANFAAPTITFGGTAATNVTAVGSSWQVTAPAHAAGAVDVVLSAPILGHTTATNVSAVESYPASFTYSVATITPATQTLSWTVGQASASAALTSAAFVGTVSYSVSPALPSGFTFDSSTGVISATATAAQSATTYTITGTGATSGTATAEVTISVKPTIAPASQTLSLTQGSAMTASTAYTPHGFPGTVTYSVSQTLPAGLSINASTGVISGTPTTAQNAAPYTVTGSDGTFTATATVSIAVAGLSPASQTVSATAGTTIPPTSALTGTGLSGTISYTVSPTLPVGLSLNASTGVISGTPTTAQQAVSYTVTGTGATSGAASASVTIAVVPVITPATQNVVATQGTALTSTQALTSTGFTSTPTYAISPTLPTGLFFNTSTGVISGTPTATQATTSYVITGTDGSNTATATVTIQTAGLTPATQALTWTVGQSNQSQALTPSGYSGGVSYSVSPALPDGLSLNTSTGVVSGIPTTAISATAYTITGAGVTSGVASATLTITINPTLAPASQAVTAVAGTAITGAQALTATGFPSAVSYAVSPSLPSGVTLNSSTGLLSGTPAAAQTTTSYTITASAGSVSASATITLSVAAAVTPVVQAVQATAGSAITATSALTPVGFPASVSYAVSPTLPNGLQLSASTGVISGTPTQAQNATVYVITATGGAFSATSSVTIQVSPALTPATQTITATHGQAISATTALSAVGFPGAVSYSVSPNLPAGLQLDASTGVISGTPTGSAQVSTPYTVTASSGGFSATATVSVSIAAVAPAAVTGAQTTVAAHQASVSWTAGDDGGAAVTSTVTAYLYDPVAQTYAATPKTCTVQGSTVCVVTGLTVGSQYEFQIVAANFAGSSTGVMTAPVTIPDSSAPATPPANTPGVQAQIRVQISGQVTGTVQPGQVVVVTGSGFAPNSLVDVYTYSSPTYLTTAQASATGNVSINVMIPTNLPVGSHTLLVTGIGADGTLANATAAYQVLANGMGLAATGFDGQGALWIVMLAALLLFAGFGILVVLRLRRRNKNATDAGTDAPILRRDLRR